MTPDDAGTPRGGMKLEERLVALGDNFDIAMSSEIAGESRSDASMAERVLGRLADDTTADAITRDRSVPWFRVAAATLLVAAVATMAVPSSREAIAGWFRLDGVRIERRVAPATTEPAPTPLDATELPGPGESREIVVDGRTVLVSVIDGALASDALVKTLGPDTQIVEVDVDGAPGLWISGEPHELAYRPPDGIIEFERIAGNTLVWQDGQRIDRVEGFDSLDDALAFALTLGTDD